MKSTDGKNLKKRREKKKIREEKESEERRCRCATRWESCKSPCFSSGSGGSKSRLAKAAGAELSDRMRDDKLHAVVAWSTCRSQNLQITQWPDHFWKLSCWKSACRCGAKRETISNSKCAKHTIVQAPWKLRCWQSACSCGAMPISNSKFTKHTIFGTLLFSEVEMHVVVVRSTPPSQHVQSTTFSEHFRKSLLAFGCGFTWLLAFGRWLHLALGFCWVLVF